MIRAPRIAWLRGGSIKAKPAMRMRAQPQLIHVTRMVRNDLVGTVGSICFGALFKLSLARGEEPVPRVGAELARDFVCVPSIRIRDVRAASNLTG